MYSWDNREAYARCLRPPGVGEGDGEGEGDDGFKSAIVASFDRRLQGVLISVKTMPEPLVPGR